MMMLSTLFAAAALVTELPYPAGVGETVLRAHPAPPPIVVELFTSQGCPPCVEANRAFGPIAAQENVIALSYGVDYWDMFGWEDQFAQPAFADRQKAYIRAGEGRRVFTPHFVINGGPERLRFRRDDVPARVAEARGLAGDITLIRLNENRVRLDLNGAARETPAEVWAVTYRPGLLLVTIEGGRNEGQEMEHHNTVASLDRLEDWPGGAYRVEFDAPAEGFGMAVLVQDSEGGPIITAARLDRR